VTYRVQLGGRVVEVSSASNVRDVCHEHDLPLELGCRGGAEGTCLMSVITGGESRSARLENQKHLGPELTREDRRYRLACQANALGSVEVETMGDGHNSRLS
jgi:ferredoxin